MSRIAVIGSGFSGLSAAAYLASYGHEVTVYEKNSSPGGRARQIKVPEGYTFDMGPSWYWMPDVFRRFFMDFDTLPEDYYQLSLLDPGFEVVYGPGDVLAVPADYDHLRALFESIEPGSAGRLDRFMRRAQYKYDTSIRSLIYSPAYSIRDYFRTEVFEGIFSLQLFTSMRRHVRRHFKDRRLRALMEFPVLFLGASPDRIPALYSLMNHAGFRLGTWYPQGGFGSVIRAMIHIGQREGVSYFFDSPVQEIIANAGRVRALVVNGETVETDAVVATADYHHIEADLLPPHYRNYRPSYWQSRTLAPSCLIYYLGVNKRLPSLKHHTLFFDGDMDLHLKDIYDDPKWPAQPQFYVSCTSRTDPSVAPSGHENLFLLLPLASGILDTEEIREHYFNVMISRLENYTRQTIRPFIDYKQSYCVNDFERDYHAYRGNAYGLANTLRQTAWMKPRMRNRKLSNLFYAGQLTVPGPGVPPSLISGKIAAGEVLNYFNSGS